MRDNREQIFDHQVERESDEGLEYFDIEDLRHFQLDSRMDLFFWKKPKSLNAEEQLKSLLSKGFELPEEWYEEDETPRIREGKEAVVQNAYFLGTLLPVLAGTAMDYAEDRLTEKDTKRVLGGINYFVDSHVEMTLGNLGGTPSLKEYIEMEEDIQMLPVSKVEMHRIVDIIWGRFMKQK